MAVPIQPAKTIKLLGELAQLPNPAIPILPSLQPNNQKQQITINYGNFTPNLSLEIYNLMGQLVYQTEVNKQIEIIPFTANNALYCYAFYNEKKELITTGKFYY
jgi:hypothetical protein